MGGNAIAAFDAQFLDATTIALGRWDQLCHIYEPCICFIIRNDSHTDVFISWDAVNNHAFVPSFSKMALNVQLNSAPSAYVSKIKKDTYFYVRGAPDKIGGSIIFSGYYIDQN